MAISKSQRIKPSVVFLAIFLFFTSGIVVAQDVENVVQKDPVFKEKAPKVIYDLPKVDLTPEITFANLLSDIALSRADASTAYQGYVFLAKKTRDPRYAELAYQVAALVGDVEGGLVAASLLKELAPNATVGQSLIAFVSMADAYALVEQKKYALAYTALTDILKKEPNNATALALLTEVTDRLGYEQEALESAEALLKLVPDDADALNTLGYLLADKNQRLGEAEKLITKALKIKPNAPYILDSMGWVLYRQNRLPEALGYLEKSLKFEVSNEVLVHLGEVQWKNNEQEAALQSFKLANELEGSTLILLDTLKRLEISLDRVNMVNQAKPESQPAKNKAQ